MVSSKLSLIISYYDLFTGWPTIVYITRVRNVRKAVCLYCKHEH